MMAMHHRDRQRRFGVTFSNSLGPLLPLLYLLEFDFMLALGWENRDEVNQQKGNAK